jgi:hypothetical protein
MMKYALNSVSWVSLVIFGLSSCSQAPSNTQEEWNRANAPELLSSSFELNFVKIPTSGSTTQMPWSDSYWPSYLGGIGARWQEWVQLGAVFLPKTASVPARIDRQLAKSLPDWRIALLSPAEKYDLYVGKVGFPLLDSERSRVSTSAAYWEGICNGWASASLIFKEPKPKDVMNTAGQKIAFTSADIKALTAYYMSQVNEGKIRVLGARCNHDLKKQPDARFRPECKDTNAGSFHLALGNMIGIQKKGFLADVFRDQQVWNQPVFAFESKILETLPRRENSAREAVRVMKIETTFKYADELAFPVAEPVLNTSYQRVTSKTVEYYVEVNEAGNVVGGEWISSFRPDFIWTQEFSEMQGYWKALSGLLELK